MLTAVATMFATTLKAQAPDPDTTARHFIIMASIGNLQEISSAQLATQKGMRADVKSFGKMMITDHGQAQQQLMALANAKRYDIPAVATSGIQSDLKLRKATSDFDRLYVHAMVVDHRSTVQMFQDYATIGKDPDVKAFAQKTLPNLKMHLQMIKAIDDQIKDVAK